MGINNMKHSWLKKHKPKQLKVQDSLVSEIPCYILASNLITLQKNLLFHFPANMAHKCSVAQKSKRIRSAITYCILEKKRHQIMSKEKRRGQTTNVEARTDF